MAPLILLLLAGLPLLRANTLIFTLRYTADPGPLVVNNTLFLYTTHDLDNATTYNMYDYSLITSTDLVNYEDRGIVFDARTASWGPRGAWAQQVLGPVASSSCPPESPGGQCYFLFWPNCFNHSYLPGEGVGVAVSAVPEGPFVDVTRGNTPLLPGDDPTVWRDETGTYLCSNAGPLPVGPLCGVLAEDMLSWQPGGEPRNLTTGFSHWFEAPWMLRLNGTYTISYMCPARNETAGPSTAGHYGEDICFATCDPSSSPPSSPCPLGTYAFSETPLQWNPPNDCSTPFGCGAGGGSNAHHGLFELQGKWFMAYHTRLLAASRGLPSASYQRNVGLDRAYLSSSGSGGGFFLPVTATPNWMRQLAWVDPFSEPVRAALMASASDGITTVASTDPVSAPARPVVFGGGVGLAFTRVSGVDFGAIAAQQQQQQQQQLLLRARLAPGTTATRVAVAAVLDDAIDGLPFALCTVTSAEWATVSCPVGGGPSLTGVHDVFLRVDATALPPGSAAVEVVSWQIGGGGAASGALPPPVVVPCTFVQAKASAGGGLWAPASSAPGAPLVANATAVVGPSTALSVVDNEDGTYALGFQVASSARVYACVGGAGAGFSLTLSSASPTEPCARFSLSGTTDGSYAFASYAGAYVEVRQGDGSLAATAADPRVAAGDAARFWLSCGAPVR
jgi:arabinoxylan arabinofuranohydrolase